MSEIDLKAKAWIIPAERMKTCKEHRVPLCDRALEILKALPREDGNDFVFIGGAARQSLNHVAMLEVLKVMRPGLTVHGFRSSFRDWSAETTNFPREVCEAALAHILPNAAGAGLQADRPVRQAAQADVGVGAVLRAEAGRRQEPYCRSDPAVKPEGLAR